MDSNTSISKPIIISWEANIDRLIYKYPKLTEKDLNFKEGKMDEMLAKLQIKLGKTRKELHKIFAAL